MKANKHISSIVSPIVMRTHQSRNVIIMYRNDKLLENRSTFSAIENFGYLYKLPSISD